MLEEVFSQKKLWSEVPDMRLLHTALCEPDQIKRGAGRGGEGWREALFYYPDDINIYTSWELLICFAGDTITRSF